MSRHLSSVFFAGVEIDPLALRKALKLGGYRFDFDIESQELTISSDGGEIARITCAYESARKFVAEFGCVHASDECVFWSIFIPELMLHDDGSKEAETIELALYRSGLPFKVIRDQAELALDRNGRHFPSTDYKLADFLGMIKEDASTYADVIALWKT